MLHRQPCEGGLGLFCLKYGSLALLLRTFCELSCHPQFQHSLYLECLYKTQVLGEYCPISIPLPSYYDLNFFNILRHYHKNSPLNIATMTVRQWYQVLLEDNVTMSPATASTPAVLLPVRIELLHPDIDWSRTWRLSGLGGLPPDLTSHMFRQLHGLLPTQDRLTRILGRGNNLTGLCRLCSDGNIETLEHSFLCSNNIRALNFLLTVSKSIYPAVTIPTWLNIS